MDKPQNIYDNETFYKEYRDMREKGLNANELVEIPNIKEMLPDLKGKRILDLGCGNGGMSKYFVNQGAESVLAIDLSVNMINEAKEKNSDEKITYVVLGMEDIEKIEGKFDMVFSSLAILGLLVYLFYFRPKSRFVQITLAMIIGGGIGNMIDRCWLGYVIDFIDFTLIDFAIFNVADSFVTVGAFMLMGYLIRDMILEIRAERAAKLASTETAPMNELSTEQTENDDE